MIDIGNYQTTINPRNIFRTNGYSFAIEAGSPSVPKAVHVKEIINFMSIFSDEI
jgi:hypothetical protein